MTNNETASKPGFLKDANDHLGIAASDATYRTPGEILGVSLNKHYEEQAETDKQSRAKSAARSVVDRTVSLRQPTQPKLDGGNLVTSITEAVHTHEETTPEPQDNRPAISRDQALNLMYDAQLQATISDPHYPISKQVSNVDAYIEANKETFRVTD